MTNRMEVKSCSVPEPSHPCDPKPPCDPYNEGEGECKDALCLEKLKNPMIPHQTRCKLGEKLDVKQCTHKEPPHPCDPPLPCVPGKPKKQPCPEISLCYQRIKNPESKIVRCPSPDDLVSKFLCRINPETLCDDEDEKKKKRDKKSQSSSINTSVSTTTPSSVPDNSSCRIS